MNDKLRDALDQSMADITWKEQNRQRVLHSVRQTAGASSLRRPFLVPVIALLILCLATAVAGAASEQFNTWLYRIWPEAAMKLMPVNMSSESQGIRMEVISAVNEGSEVYVTFSMKDLEKNRITRDTQAYASARSGSAGTLVSQQAEPLYQPDDQTMVFGQRIRFDDSLQENRTLLFYVDSLVPIQEQETDLMPLYRQYAAEAKSMPVPENAKAFRVASPDEIRRSGEGGADPDSLSEEDLAYLRFSNLRETTIPEEMHVLDSRSGPEIPLAEGITLSGIGMADGLLHVQIHMSNYWQLNAPGLDHFADPWISLYDAEANEIYTSKVQYTGPDKLPNGISYLRWNEFLENGRVDYWEEMIFAVDGEPAEAQKLLANIFIYDKAVSGWWQADIPVRLIRNNP